MNHIIKILQFTVASTKGGRTQYVLNVWNHIDKERFCFDFITFSKDLDFEEDIIRNGGRVFHISAHPEKSMQQFVKEFNEVLKNEYDVIEIHTSYWVSTVVEELANRAKIPKIIIHAHSTGIGINEVWDEKKRDYYLDLHHRVRNSLTQSLATDYWACSREAAEWLFSDRIPFERIEILHNTIDTELFQYNDTKRKEIRKKLNLNGKTVLGFTGRLEKVKNVEFLIEVLREIIVIRPNMMLLIVGDGRLKKELEHICGQYGLKIGEDVIFTGHVENVVDHLQAMDIFVMPSHFEGFSLSTLEAQCTGLQCVVSNNVPEAVAVTELVTRLPLEVKTWVERIIDTPIEYNRRNRRSDLIRKGFDTAHYIKVLEEKYAN